MSVTLAESIYCLNLHLTDREDSTTHLKVVSLLPEIVLTDKMESHEENSERPNDLLERSVLLEMGDDGVYTTPEDIVNEKEIAIAQEKTTENVKMMNQLRKLSSTNPTGAKESVNLPRRRSQKPTLPNARRK